MKTCFLPAALVLLRLPETGEDWGETEDLTGFWRDTHWGIVWRIEKDGRQYQGFKFHIPDYVRRSEKSISPDPISRPSLRVKSGPDGQLTGQLQLWRRTSRPRTPAVQSRLLVSVALDHGATNPGGHDRNEVYNRSCTQIETPDVPFHLGRLEKTETRRYILPVYVGGTRRQTPDKNLIKYRMANFKEVFETRCVDDALHGVNAVSRIRAFTAFAAAIDKKPIYKIAFIWLLSMGMIFERFGGDVTESLINPIAELWTLLMFLYRLCFVNGLY